MDRRGSADRAVALQVRARRDFGLAAYLVGGREGVSAYRGHLQRADGTGSQTTGIGCLLAPTPIREYTPLGSPRRGFYFGECAENGGERRAAHDMMIQL